MTAADLPRVKRRMRGGALEFVVLCAGGGRLEAALGCRGHAVLVAEDIRERMRRPSVQPREILLPARLVVRESTRGKAIAQ